MKVSKPLFLIPEQNRQSKSKSGGGTLPKSLIDKNDLFEEHKTRRKQEVTGIINDYSLDTAIDNLNLNMDTPKQVYFEIALNMNKVSKTDQNYVRDLLRNDSIDLLSRKSENKFTASAEVQKLKNFKETIDNLKFDSKNKRLQKQSNVFSYIEQIEKLSREDILITPHSKSKDREFIGYIFFHTNISSSSIQKIYLKIKEMSGSNNDVRLVSTSFNKQAVYGEFTRDLIDVISTPSVKNPVAKIEPDIEFILKQDLRTTGDFENIKVVIPSTENAIGIVDSGIASTHPLFKDLVIGRVDQLNGRTNDESHGTFVASRAVFGNDIEDALSKGVLTATSKILDVAVITDNTKGNDVLEAIKNSIENYPQIKVYNLSLGMPEGAIDVFNGKKSTFTRELDTLAKKFGILFVVAAGNHSTYWDKNSKYHLSYPDCILQEPQSTIIPPGDGVNVLTVGSLADIESTKSIARRNEPSPFTRMGRIGGQLKPELSHYGGNLDKYRNEAGIGVKGLSVDTKSLQEGVGTSYAAPLVSQIAVQISSYLDENNINSAKNIDLTKALIVHSAKQAPIGQNPRIDSENLDRMVGYGLPSVDSAIECVEHRATFIFQDRLSLVKDLQDKRSNIHEIYFDIPDELKKQSRKIKLKATLAYTPPVSSDSNENDYYESRIEMTCHHINSKGKYNNRTRKTPSNWSPLKQESFEFKPTQYDHGRWKVALTLTAQGFSDNEEFHQPYSLVISIEDITDDNEPKTNIYEIIKTKYPIYQNIQITNKTKLRIS